MHLSKQFQVDLGFDPTEVCYHAHIFSLADKKMRAIKATKLAPLMKEVTKAIRKKEILNRKFPIVPEERRIILPNESECAPKLLIPGRNGH